jgi:hypothetical protein
MTFQFYYKEKFYDTFEDFMKATIYWSDKITTEEDLKNMLEVLTKQVILNFNLYGFKIKNSQAQQIISLHADMISLDMIGKNDKSLYLPINIPEGTENLKDNLVKPKDF